MKSLIEMYPKAMIKLLDKCFVNMFVRGHTPDFKLENTEYYGYDFSFLMPDEGIIMTYIYLRLG